MVFVYGVREIHLLELCVRLLDLKTILRMIDTISADQCC